MFSVGYVNRQYFETAVMSLSQLNGEGTREKTFRFPAYVSGDEGLEISSSSLTVAAALRRGRRNHC